MRAGNTTNSKPSISDWLIWQLIDSAFPTGGFAHSSGLEAAWQHGEVRGRAELAAFVETSLDQLAHAALPFVLAAYDKPEMLNEFDSLCDLFTTNHVANRASRAQGRAFSTTCSRVWPSPAVSAVDALVRQGAGHAGPAMGAMLAALAVPAESARQLCLYGTARGVLAAAVRLGIAGSYDAQRLQHDVTAAMLAVADRCRALDERDLAQTAPLLDLLGAAHDRLYSRLFQS